MPLPSTAPQPDSIVGRLCLSFTPVPDTALVDFDTVRIFTYRGSYDGDLALLFRDSVIVRQLVRYYGGRWLAASIIGDSVIVNMPPRETEWYIQMRGQRLADTVSGAWFDLATYRHPGRFRMVRINSDASGCLTTR